MILRPATRADGAALAALHAAAFDEPWSADDILRFAEDRGGFAVAAEADGGLAGFILCRMIAGEAEVLTLAVRPQLRRRGVGRALLEAAIALARPSAETMGWRPASVKSTMARRRKLSAAPASASTQICASSGPRCSITLPIRRARSASTSAGVVRARSRKPVRPHKA